MKSLLLALLLSPLILTAAERETFDASETVEKERAVTRQAASGSSQKARTAGHKSAKELAIPSGAKVVRLVVGESKLIFTGRKGLFKPALAFYLPPESTAVAQLIVETKGRDTNYFIKGRAPGVTVGGEVSREWLDESGFRPRNEADHARIQQAVKATPLYIEVR